MTENSNENFSSSPLDSNSDATLARYQKRLLEQMSKNDKNPVLAEMAQELLAGHVTLRQVFENEAYSEALIEAGSAAAQKYAEMPEEELLAAYQDGQAVLDQLDAAEAEADTAEDAAPNTDERSGDQAPAGDHADDGTEPAGDDPIESFLIDPAAR